jgi:hypothetical protein
MPTITLVPFNITSTPDVQVQATLERKDSVISIRYEIRGNVASLQIPSSKQTPERLDGLWNHTCCEAFISKDGHNAYKELNFSPSGDWNVYSFTNYQEGHQLDSDLKILSQQFIVDTNKLSLVVAIDVGQELERAQLNVGITTVLQLKDNSITYWAVSHEAERPDFHVRKSFSIVI